MKVLNPHKLHCNQDSIHDNTLQYYNNMGVSQLDEAASFLGYLK